MKRFSFLLAALFVIGTMAFAQKTDQAVDQYGNKVNVKEVTATERDGILVFESKDKDFKFWFDSRVQVDFGHYFGAQEWADPIGDGASIRRARFAVKTQINRDWYGEVDMELANGSFELKDAIVRYNGLENWQFSVGSQKPDFSLSRNTSSRYLEFMERPMVVSAFAPSRHLGIFAKYNNKYFFGSASILFQEIEGQETRDYVEAASKKGMDEGLSYIGKIVLRPVNETNYGVHIGGAVMYDQPKTSDETWKDKGTRFSCRNATNISRIKFLDTDDLLNSKYNLIATAELAGHVDGLRVESAWLSDWTYMDPEKVVLDKPYHFYGWYVECGYLLFGGRQSYDSGSAKFNRVRNGRTWGDVELGLKYEFVDLNDYEGRSTDVAVYGGSAELYGAALNFYLGKNTKIALNYQYVNNDRYANAKGKMICGLDADGNATNNFMNVDAAAGDAGINYHMLLARFQVAF